MSDAGKWNWKESLSEPGCATLNFFYETNCTKCCEVRLASHSLYLFLTNKDSIFVHTWSRKNSQKSYALWVCLQVYFEPCVLSHFSHVWLFATPWTVACQAPLSMGFSRQEYWSGLPFLPPGDLPYPEIEPASLTSICIGRWVLYHWCHLEIHRANKWTV